MCSGSGRNIHNAESATTYFRLPPNRVVEIGSQVEV